MNRDKVKKLVLAAMFCALAFVCEFAFRIKVQFLTFDVKDAILTIGAMLLGPVYGIVTSFIVAFLEFISVSDTGIWGFVMNFVSSAVFACSASILYNIPNKYKKTVSGAVMGLTAGVILMTASMIGMNLIITPIYTGMDVSKIAAMILPLLLPFNLLKSLLNAGITLVLYKPVSTALKRAHMIKGQPDSYTFGKKTVILTICGAVLITVCVVLFILAMNGTFEIFK